jgi:hypothetical protein
LFARTTNSVSPCNLMLDCGLLVWRLGIADQLRGFVFVGNSET